MRSLKSSGPAGKTADAAESRRASAGLIEGAWLAAAAIVPLFYNSYAFHAFQPSKVAVLLLLAAIVAMALLTDTFLARGFPAPGKRLPRPVRIALLFLLGGEVLATVFSVNPHSSLWGAEDTRQGLITLLAEPIIFLAVVCYTERFSQVRRLVNVLIAASIPVALFGVIQRAGFDRTEYPDFHDRVYSMLGHPIFFAAYLTMVMPPTWWKLWQESGPRPAGQSRSRRVWGLCFYLAVAILQLAGFFCAQSRGPLLGLAATAISFGFAFAVLARRRQWLLRVAAILGIAAALLVFLNLPLAASTRLARVLGVERFADTFGLRKGADPFRKAHWQAAVDLMTSRDPIAFPSGGSDPWHALRLWIGYGPETLENVLAQRFMWTTTDPKIESRLHNRVLDLWFATGALGAVAFFAFFVVVWKQGIQYLGLAPGRLAYFIIAGAGVAGSGLFAAIGGRGFLGLGLIAGVGVGCALSILPTIGQNREPAADSKTGTPAGALVVALLSAMIGHLVETGFAFTVVATSLQFWLYAAMILAITGLGDSTGDSIVDPAPRRSRGRRSPKPPTNPAPSWSEAWMTACASSLILVTVLFAFIRNYSFASADWTTVLAHSVAAPVGDLGHGCLVWFLIVPTWLAANYLCAGGEEIDLAKGLLMPLAVSAAIGGVFAILIAAFTAHIGAMPGLTDPTGDAVGQSSQYHFLYAIYLGVVLALLACTALFLNRSKRNEASFSFAAISTNLAPIALGVLAAWFLAFRDARADMTARWADSLLSQGRWEAGAEVLRQSVREQPSSVENRRRLANELLIHAPPGADQGGFEWRAHEAQDLLLPISGQAHGLSMVSFDLAQIDFQRAAYFLDPDERLAAARQAAGYFQQFQRFLPGQAISWLDSVILEQQYLHQPEEAERKLQMAVAVMNGRLDYWANWYRDKCLRCPTPALRDSYAWLAFRLTDLAIREAPDPAGAALARMDRAAFHFNLGQLNEARQDALDSLTALPPGAQWQADATLAAVDWQTGRVAEARGHLEKALATAPPEKRPMLLDLGHRMNVP